jgi:hypothetical protein
MKKPAIAFTLALAACAAGAQQVWRCGNSYSQQPCPGGSPLDVTDPHRPADAARVERATKSDWQRAQALEKARLDQEKKAPRAQVMGGPQAPASAPQAAKKQDKKDGKKAGPKEPAHFTAVAPKK